MKIRNIIQSIILVIVSLQLLFCVSNVIAEKSESETKNIKIAVWGFHYLDLDSRTMCKYLTKDFSEVAKDFPDIKVISSKDIKKALGKTKLEELDQVIVLDLAKKVEANISIWGHVSQIGSTLYNVNFFILDTQTEDIQFERLKIAKKKEERLKSISQIISKAIALSKSAETKAMEIALNFFNSEQYEDAKNAFLNLIELNPDEKTAYQHLAYIEAVNEDYESAIDYYGQALRIDSEYIQALEGLAWAYKMNEDLEQSCETYLQLAESNPENIDYWCNVGDICQIQENFDDAVSAYQSAIKHDSTCIKAHKAIGLLYFENDYFNEAIPHLKTVLGADIEAGGVEKKLAIAYQKTGRLEECIKQNLEIIRGDSTLTSPYLNLAAAYTTQQHFDDALDALRKYINLAPNSEAGYNRISDVYRQMKNYEDAITNAKKSAEIAPDKPEAYLLLAEIDNERGYIHYQNFVKYDEKAKNPDLSNEYEENNKLRGFHKKKAQAYFVFAKEYFTKANSLMTDFFTKEKLKEKLKTVNLLIEETKFDPFYDE
ncbi:MAG: tetratricopeptide repeat protein [Candidatus Cloacimonetes bacterium]|nr:tetratricopeptide repeat protein [Candidatus Cloacimonadota bacterium]